MAARALIIKAQFDGYKNSQLETAIRQHVSQQRDAEFNAEFERIVGLVRDGEPASMVRASSEVLVGEIKDELPGLPLIESAKSPKSEASAEPRKDWRKVQADILRAIERGHRRVPRRPGGKGCRARPGYVFRLVRSERHGKPHRRTRRDI